MDKENQSSLWAHLFKTCLGFFIGGVIAGILHVNPIVMIALVIAGGIIARVIDHAIYKEDTNSYRAIWMPVVAMFVPFGGMLGVGGWLIGKSLG
jgi:sterol desaturase/sphingolipid hydroxylase (fatty acid hydroxylase superfamily)